MATKIEVIIALEKFGLSAYEAKAYLAALSEYPISGYKLSKISGVPRSRIYETVEKLMTKGLLIVQPGDVTLIKPVSLEAFLARKEDELKKAMEFLYESTEELKQSVQDSGTWNIFGREQIFETLKHVFSDANSHIYVAAHTEDLLPLVQVLEKTATRGVKMDGVYCGNASQLLPPWIEPHRGGTCLACRDIAVSIDSRRALVGSTLPQDTATIVLTENPGIVHIVEEHIKHEIFISRAVLLDMPISPARIEELYRQIMTELS